MVFKTVPSKRILPSPKIVTNETASLARGFMALVIHRQTVESCYSKIPNNITQGLGYLSSKAKVLYIFLYSQGPTYRPTIDGLAHAIWDKGNRQSRSSIERQVHELQIAGLLVIEKRGPKKYDWHLYDPSQRIEK